MGRKTFKIIIIIIDIIAVLLIGYTFVKWNEKHGKSVIDDNTFVFKKYTYSNIPSNLTITEYDQYKFRIKGDTYYAYVEIYHDPKSYIIMYNNYYQDMLREEGYDIKNSTQGKIENNDVIIYQTIYNNQNVIVCDFVASDGFTYEVTLYNDDNSTSIEPLNEILKVLNTGKYDSESKEKYHYMYMFYDWNPPTE